MADKLVLIVEDNERTLKLERTVLQLEGYRTLEARTGEEGVELALGNIPDLILMDIRLPGIDGVEALRKLRTDLRTASIPVIALTTSAMSDDIERFREAGFDGYLTKPVELRRFRQEVAAQCGVAVTES